MTTGDVKRTESGLRALAEPFVVAMPSGTSTRTRLDPDQQTSAALDEIGSALGAQYRAMVVSRLDAGKLDAEQKAEWRAKEKQAATAAATSRWAGAMTRLAEGQYRLATDAMYAERRMLQSAIETITERLAPDAEKPYRASDRHGKARRRGQLQQRLAAVEVRISAERPRLALGGGRLWSTKSNLEAAELSEDQWRERWNARRMFITADGESGKTHGNETIGVDANGKVRIRVPDALVHKFGKYLFVQARPFTVRGDEWSERVTAKKSVSYSISYDAERERWYLDASWKYPKASPVPVDALRSGAVLGVDLNKGHLAAHVLDSDGNPVGKPLTVPLVVEGLPASTRDARLREAISQLIRIAKSQSAVAIVIENLNFADARNTGRETMGRGGRGKQFRRTVAGLPTAKFRDRLTAMAATAGISIISVDPAYTSKWGSQHWKKPLKTSDPTATGHHAAAVAIGRRGLAHPIRRKPSGPRPRQRTTLGTPTAAGSVQRRPLTSKAPRRRSDTIRPGGETAANRGAPKTVRGAVERVDRRNRTS